MKFIFTKCLWTSILLGLAQFSYPPTGQVADVGKYLRVLKALKDGNMEMPDLNNTARPWNYTSQGLEFERKLKESEFLDVFYLVPNMLVCKIIVLLGISKKTSHNIQNLHVNIINMIF